MSDNDAKAKILADEADKILNSSGIMNLFSRKSRIEDAIEKYRKAGNLYKLSKNWSKAGECFQKCASHHERNTEAAIFYLDAANCYRKISATDTANCYGKAIEVYKDLGRFSMVAKYYQMIAEVYEEFENYEEAIKNFEEAADYYNTEGATSAANKCLIKVAMYSALVDDYTRAIKYYEDVSKSVSKSPLLKYSVKEYYFKALICALCYKIDEADRLKGVYVKEYPPLQDSREFKLFLTLLECVVNNKVDEFSEAIEEYDKISRLDEWYTKMFLKIKKIIDSGLFIVNQQQCIFCNNFNNSINNLALNLLTEIHVETHNDVNYIISPYNIWLLLAIVYIGSTGETANQLKNSLQLEFDNEIFLNEFSRIQNDLLNKNQSQLELNIKNFMFLDRYFNLKETFEQSIKNSNIEIMRLNFARIVKTRKLINEYIANITNNRLLNFFNIDDLKEVKLLLATINYFKGTWKYPFDENKSFNTNFYDNLDNIIGNVTMMTQINYFPYSFVKELSCHCIELPYSSNTSKFSMILFLPQKRIHILDVISKLKNRSFSDIYKILDDSFDQFAEEQINVTIPKFSVSSDFILNIVLKKLGIIDVFDPTKANFSQLTDKRIYLSRLIHKADIEVNEKGVIASTGSGSSFVSKSSPPKFIANRPFIYAIVERTMNIILFIGCITTSNF